MKVCESTQEFFYAIAQSAQQNVYFPVEAMHYRPCPKTDTVDETYGSKEFLST